MIQDWIRSQLENPQTRDLCFNGSHGTFLDQGNGLEPQTLSYSESELKTWVLEMLSQNGITWDQKRPFVDVPLYGRHRMHVLFPPLTDQGLLVSIRAHPQKPSDFRWEHSKEAFFFLSEKFQKKDSLLIAGATGSGKTTLANDLLHTLSHQERILALEDVRELSPQHPHFLSLQSRQANPDGFGEITLRDLLRQSLRMRPDRIVLGECRGEEVLDLLQILNTGHRGALATLHANSARDALRRIELLCLLSSKPIPHLVIRELLSSGIQWLCTVAHHQIEEIWKLEGIENQTLILRPHFSSKREAVTPQKNSEGLWEKRSAKSFLPTLSHNASHTLPPFSR